MDKASAALIVTKIEALETASSLCRYVAERKRHDYRAIEDAHDKYATARAELQEAFEKAK